MPPESDATSRTPNADPNTDGSNNGRSTFVDIPLQPGSQPSSTHERAGPRIEKWSLGILNDTRTEEVPGTVLLLASKKNEPLGMRRESPDGRRQSSMPPQDYQPAQRQPTQEEKKRTANGEIILDPQPDDSLNDPLNWPMWRRDAALFSLGFYCQFPALF